MVWSQLILKQSGIDHLDKPNCSYGRQHYQQRNLNLNKGVKHSHMKYLLAQRNCSVINNISVRFSLSPEHYRQSQVNITTKLNSVAKLLSCTVSLTV